MSAQESHLILKTLEQEKYWILPLVQSQTGSSCTHLNWSRIGLSISRTLQQSGQSLQTWLSCLRDGGPSELSVFLNHESSWFRNPGIFEVLHTIVLPRFIQANRNRPLRFWSAGCAHGQEVFSLAMLIHRFFPELWSDGVFLWATDLSETALSIARNGIYTETDLHRGLPNTYKKQYFTSVESNTWQISPLIRNKVCFEHHALQGTWDNVPTFDVILMRNVRLYLRSEVQADLDNNVHRHLAERGLWFLGASELVFPDNQHWDKHWSGALSWFEKK